MINKYKYKTLAICLEKEVYAELDKYCEGKTYKSVFVRRLIKNALNKIKSKNINNDDENKNNKVIKVKVDNYFEIEEYVRQKKFGNVSSFATFAMAQYMSRFAVKNNDEKEQN
ncbi:unclassified [Brachyspira pilosicoli WesB]|uniref:Unclassified n=1 Tax=Brachyspira pilosicoli WesB TaxID=1161918 RepID=K0JGB3_BRAPL|nr:hypothetical protein [Brachyspira pilosicoli]CCG55792.1 unclassified [Brachyspira pilosicoli WesB]